MWEGGHEPVLQWVMVDGVLHHVTDFAHLKPIDRPEIVCPVCERLVTMKLGRIRVHHVAHQPGDGCAATKPETALHLNAKYHIANELKKTSRLLIHQPCDMARMWACDAVRDVVWLEGWDEVQVEYRLDPYRPDIALLKNGKALGAIEVMVTHMVGPDKAEHLRKLGLSWLEIEAYTWLYEGDTPWTAEQPMEHFRLQPKPGGWICPKCDEREKRIAVYRAEEERKREVEEEYRRHNYKAVYCFRVVDYYWPNGEKYREVYAVVEKVRRGRRVALWLMTPEKTLARIKGLSVEAPKQALRKAFEAHQEGMRERGAIADSPMGWLLAQDVPVVYFEVVDQGMGDKFIVSRFVYDNRCFPRRYKWWRKEHQWFLPQANRKLRWEVPASRD